MTCSVSNSGTKFSLVASFKVKYTKRLSTRSSDSYIFTGVGLTVVCVCVCVCVCGYVENGPPKSCRHTADGQIGAARDKITKASYKLSDSLNQGRDSERLV